MSAWFARSRWPLGLLGLAMSGCGGTPSAPDDAGGGAADVVLDESSVNLGEIDVGVDATAMLTLRNIGTGTAQIQRVQIVGSDKVSVRGDPCTGDLAPARSCDITLAIRPALAGPLAADVAIETSAGNVTGHVAATGRAFVTVTPVGAAGAVTSDPPGIACGAGASACRAAFTVPQIVLRVSDDVTIRWSGACAGHGDCELMLDRAPDVTAAMFAPLVITHAEPGSQANLAYGVAIDPANRMIVTGEGPGPLTGVSLTLAFEPGGALAWADRFDPGAEGHDTGHAVAIDAAGNTIIAGQWYSSSWTRFNAFARKLTSSGAPVYGWGHESEDIGDDGYRGIAIDAKTGAIYVVGFTPDPSAILPAIHVQGWIRKLDAQGQPVWSRMWQGSPDGDDAALDVAVDGAGNAIVVGRVATATNGADAWIAAYSPSGDVVWSDVRGGAGNDEAAAVAIAADGSLTIAGTQAGAGWIATYDNKHERGRELVTPDVAGWQGAAHDGAGELVVTGDEQTRVYTAGGELVWSRAHPGFHAQDVAIDNSGNIVVVGWVGNAITVIKYYQ